MPLYWREIEVDDLKNELTKDDENFNRLTTQELEGKLRSNIGLGRSGPSYMGNTDPFEAAEDNYQVHEISEEFERDHPDSKHSSKK